MVNKFRIDRRTHLKGLGAALALPLLDSMGWADDSKTARPKPPVRISFMYMPHGVIPDQFWPASAESFLTSPPPALESLKPVLDQCLLMKGISGVPIAPFNGAPHALELSTWLTAQLPDADTRSQINIAISADQVAANFVGGFTSLRSLELATMPQTHKENQEGLNEGYYTHCSFRSPTQPVPAETNPRSVLNRLFGKTDQPGQIEKVNPLDRQMLDLVLDGAKDLRRRLPHDDQHKLDEYLDSVRAVERRIAAIEHRQKEAALEKAGVASSKRNASDPRLLKSRYRWATNAASTCRSCATSTYSLFKPTRRASVPISARRPTAYPIPSLGLTTSIIRRPITKQTRAGCESRCDYRVQHRPVRLYGAEDGQPPRRGRHVARQLHHDVGLGSGRRQQALTR